MPVFCQHRTSPTKTFKCGPSFAALSGLSAEMFWHSIWITNREICHYDWFGQNVGGLWGGSRGLVFIIPKGTWSVRQQHVGVHMLCLHLTASVPRFPS